MTLYTCKDNNGKLWRDYISEFKHLLKLKVASDLFSICKIDSTDADNVWRILEKNGWEIVELEIILKSSV